MHGGFSTWIEDLVLVVGVTILVFGKQLFLIFLASLGFASVMARFFKHSEAWSRWWGLASGVLAAGILILFNSWLFEPYVGILTIGTDPWILALVAAVTWYLGTAFSRTFWSRPGR